jgi:hypothetical protein
LYIQGETVTGFVAIATTLIFAAAGIAAGADGPQYTNDGKLVRPANYREWIFLSSGSGMTYGPAAQSAHGEHPPFDNVFVNPSAYRSFLETGRWPDQTVFVLEVRASQSNGSINKGGLFQTGALAMEVHVKDEKRFPGKWAFFGFDGNAASGKLFPTTEDCYSCHAQHGAVDTTFVQFYPTLIDIAKKKGTFSKTAE